MLFRCCITLPKYLFAISLIFFTILLYHINVYSLSGQRMCGECISDKQRKKYFSLRATEIPAEREKEATLRTYCINTDSDQNKMDDTSDPLNLLEQKVIRLLSEHSCKMPTTAERTRTFKSSVFRKHSQVKKCFRQPARSTDILYCNVLAKIIHIIELLNNAHVRGESMHIAKSWILE